LGQEQLQLKTTNASDKGIDPSKCHKTQTNAGWDQHQVYILGMPLQRQYHNLHPGEHSSSTITFHPTRPDTKQALGYASLLLSTP